MICKFEDLGKSNLIPGCIYEGGDSKTPLKDDPLIKLFKVDGYKKGIGNIGGFRKASKEENGKIINENIAFVVMSGLMRWMKIRAFLSIMVIIELQEMIFLKLRNWEINFYMKFLKKHI